EEIAASIAVAVDHCAAYEELGRLRDEQAALLEINRTVARHLHRDELFATLAQCLRDVLPSDRFGIELPVAGDKLRAYVLATRNAESTPVQVEELPSAGTACRWTEETRQWRVASSRGGVRGPFAPSPPARAAKYLRVHPKQARAPHTPDRPPDPHPRRPPRPSAADGDLPCNVRGSGREPVVRTCEGSLHRSPGAPRPPLRARR